MDTFRQFADDFSFQTGNVAGFSSNLLEEFERVGYSPMSGGLGRRLYPGSYRSLYESETSGVAIGSGADAMAVVRR